MAKKLEGTEAVDAFLRDAEHPMKDVVVAIRKIILGADGRVIEGIKWNGPSFFYKDYFATTGFRSTEFVQVVLHTGAKTKASAAGGVKIDDPAGLLEWHAKDRCSVKFRDVKDVKAKKAAFQAIIREWVEQM